MTTERDDLDPGGPIEELAALRAPVREGFVGRVRERIDRRVLAFSVFDMTWSGLGTVFLELLNVIFGIFGARKADPGGEQPWNKKD